MIRIGSPANHVSAFVAGINNVNISSGSQVLINANGQLGTIQSSLRYKDDIRDMADSSNGLMSLRPVTFRYKQAAEDGTKALHYGLIGEEVAKVYPELIVRGSHGEIESVQYHELPALLLNELQKQHKLVVSQENELEDTRKAINAQRSEIASLELQVAALKAAISKSRETTTKRRP